jgi:3-hydroxyacyl-CoA dehydrogenase
VATVFALAKALGKTPVVVKDSPGFLVNRILAPYLAEAARLLLDGCRIEDVDAAMKEFGMPVGPLALLDDVGLDVAAKAGEVLQAAFPERLKVGGEEALATAGRLGRKNGKGFYDYDGSKRRGPAREAYALLRLTPPEKPSLPAEVIQARLLLPMINEAAFCLEDEVVPDPARLDLAMIFGTGFPPFRGGLLRYADTIGLDRVFSRLDDLAERLGPRFAPAESIRDLANARRGFFAADAAATRELVL